MSVAVHAFSGNVHWPIAGLMMISAIAGGYAAASFGRRLPPLYIRYFVIAMSPAKRWWQPWNKRDITFRGSPLRWSPGFSRPDRLKAELQQSVCE